MIMEIPHNTMVKVATATITTGLTIMEGNKKYYRVPVPTGDTAPSLPENLDSPRIPSTSPWIEIPWFNSKFVPKESSDLYIYCTNGSPNINGLLEVL